MPDLTPAVWFYQRGLRDTATGRRRCCSATGRIGGLCGSHAVQARPGRVFVMMSIFYSLFEPVL